MTLVVRDEEDILDANLRFHLAQGIDFIYALDHNSRDGTPDILRRYEQMGVLRMLREEGDVHDQSRRSTRLARLAATELRADWVINNDADEFWWPTLGTLRGVLGAIPERYGALTVRRANFPAAIDADGAFYEHMTVREVASLTPTGHGLEPKVVHRAHRDAVVAAGNHSVTWTGLRWAPAIPVIEVMHFPIRSYAQFERKVIQAGRGYELLGAHAGIGHDQRRLFEIYRRGELPLYFAEHALDAPAIERGIAEGQLVRDDRLLRFLEGGAAPAEPHAEAGAVDAIVDAACQADTERLRLEADVDAAREARRRAEEEAGQAWHALNLLLASRTLRYSRPVRLAWHRARRAAGGR